jgi:ATP-dependent 26S proteasome regulatory subunit
MERRGRTLGSWEAGKPPVHGPAGPAELPNVPRLPPIEVPLPDRRGCLAMLRVHLSKMKVGKPLDLEPFVEQTAGFSGAELAGLCREAGLMAIQRGITQAIPPSQLAVTRLDLKQALQSLRAKRTSELTEQARPRGC